MPETDPPPAPARRKSRLVPVLAVVALIVLALGVVWWWYNRPIEPVVLDAAEIAAVEAKIEAIQPSDDGPAYERGSKEIVLTERELNGLLNQNTSLGKSVKLELTRNAVHARIETDLNPEIPIVGGKRLRARARFFVSKTPGQPALTLDDVTVWGISLPNDWLGGIKGHDLLEEASGGKISGVEEFSVEPGKLIIRLEE